MPSHTDSQRVPYSQEQLFDLVADVAKYPQFLPWCVAARIRSRTQSELLADLTIGFGPFRESFTSRVALHRPSRIVVRYENGPFHHLTNSWDFRPDPASTPGGISADTSGATPAGGTIVDFHVEFEFRSRVLEAVIGTVFQEAVRRMVGAFHKRAREIYGTPAAPREIAPDFPGNQATPAKI